jgi:hypothetical protein
VSYITIKVFCRSVLLAFINCTYFISVNDRSWQHDIKHTFLLCGRGVLGCEESICVMTSIIPTHMSHPISCTDSELALIIWPRFTWTVLTWPTGKRKPQYGHSLPWPIGAQNPYGQSLTWPKALNPIWPVLNLNMGGNPNLVPRAFVWGRGERRESPGLGRSILHSDWLTPYCLKITELDSWQ